ncbi:MAG: hypothetical protein ACTHLR_07665, partial [Rhizomicrobium sp.]
MTYLFPLTQLVIPGSDRRGRGEGDPDGKSELILETKKRDMAALVAAIHFPETSPNMANASGKWITGTSPVMSDVFSRMRK